MTDEQLLSPVEPVADVPAEGGRPASSERGPSAVPPATQGVVMLLLTVVAVCLVVMAANAVRQTRFMARQDCFQRASNYRPDSFNFDGAYRAALAKACGGGEPV